MGRVLIYFGRFALIFVAYVCASLAASAFIHIVVAAGARLRRLQHAGSPYGGAGLLDPVRRAVRLLFRLPAVAAGDPGWRRRSDGAAGCFTRWRAARSRWSIIAFAIQASEPGDNPFADTRLSAAVVGGGIVGGMAYWLVAGRLAGNWRAKARPQLRENA